MCVLLAWVIPHLLTTYPPPHPPPCISYLCPILPPSSLHPLPLLYSLTHYHSLVVHSGSKLDKEFHKELYTNRNLSPLISSLSVLTLLFSFYLFSLLPSLPAHLSPLTSTLYKICLCEEGRREGRRGEE